MQIFGREHGVKLGAGGPATEELQAIQRKERLRALTAEAYDLKNDPYILRNHLGTYECKLCFTLHPSQENYVVHTQGKKHKDNLGKRIHRLNKDKGVITNTDKKHVEIKQTPRIGKPGYQIYKQYDKSTGAHSLLFRLLYPDITEGLRPRFRIVSSYEQKVATPSDDYQYVVFAAEPYETVGMRIPNIPLDKTQDRFLTNWNADTKVFTLQITFKDGFNTKYHREAASSTSEYSGAGAVQGNEQQPQQDQNQAQQYTMNDLWGSY
jgi:splicing factor 3A subunit 2